MNPTARPTTTTEQTSRVFSGFYDFRRPKVLLTIGVLQ